MGPSLHWSFLSKIFIQGTLGGEASPSTTYSLVNDTSSYLFSFIFCCNSMAENHHWRTLLKLKDPTSIEASQASFHLSEEEYIKIHSYRSAKQMYDTLALTYEGSSYVKHNKLSLLTRTYKLVTMEDGEDIQTMLEIF